MSPKAWSITKPYSSTIAFYRDASRFFAITCDAWNTNRFLCLAFLCLFDCLFKSHLFICLGIYLLVFCIYLSVYLSIHVFIHVSTCLYTHILCVYTYAHLSQKKTQSQKLPTGCFRCAVATSLRCALKNLTRDQHNRWRNQIGHSVHSNHVVGRTWKNYISLHPTARTNLRIQGLQ